MVVAREVWCFNWPPNLPQKIQRGSDSSGDSPSETPVASPTPSPRSRVSSSKGAHIRTSGSTNWHTPSASMAHFPVLKASWMLEAWAAQPVKVFPSVGRLGYVAYESGVARALGTLPVFIQGKRALVRVVLSVRPTGRGGGIGASQIFILPERKSVLVLGGWARHPSPPPPPG